MSLDITLYTPKCCPECGHELGEPIDCFNYNITGNLAGMASEAGIYYHLWRPEEIGIKTAGKLIEPLRKAVKELEDDPNRFKAHNAKNGWGTYATFLPFVRQYLAACIKYPEAEISIWR